MARGSVHFQKGLSEADFQKLYGTEELCRAAILQLRWPDGFQCPVCHGRAHCVIRTRTVYQCDACRSQTSLTAGTIFANTKLELKVWFQAMYHMTQSKQGISTVELGRRLGVRQPTAWAMKNKLERQDDDSKRLIGRVEMDDAYLGGERSGGKRGRGAPGKKPFVAAVSTTAEGKPSKVNCAASSASPRPRSRRWPRRPWTRAPRSIPMAWAASPASRRPASPTCRCASVDCSTRPRCRGSNGSTRSWATSRVPSRAPIERCAATPTGRWPSSNTASTGASILPR